MHGAGVAFYFFQGSEAAGREQRADGPEHQGCRQTGQQGGCCVSIGRVAEAEVNGNEQRKAGEKQGANLNEQHM